MRVGQLSDLGSAQQQRVSGWRWLEVRRHSLTKKGPARGRGSHLSAQGVTLARAVGAELVAQGRGLAAVARAHRAAWTRAAASVTDGAAALVVSHGGAIEPTLVVCLPDADHAHWGALLATAMAPAWGS